MCLAIPVYEGSLSRCLTPGAVLSTEIYPNVRDEILFESYYVRTTERLCDKDERKPIIRSHLEM